MSLKCNWPNCSMEFGDQKQLKEHLMRKHVGEQQKSEQKMDTIEATSSTSKTEKKKIFLPVETFVDILLWISRIELAQSVSLTCWLFNEISRPRLDEQNARIVRPLRFSEDRKNRGAVVLHFLGTCRKIPIAQLPPPINILGFERLDINHYNHKVLQFLGNIEPLLGTNIHMSFDCYNLPMQNSNELENILAGKVSHLNSPNEYFNNKLGMEFIKTIQFVRLWDGIGQKIERIERSRVLEWLHSPMLNEGGRVAGKSRYMFAHLRNINKFAEICKERFMKSTTPVSFVFHFDTIYGNPKLFSIENQQTGEQLELGWHYDNDYSYFMLRRSPIGDDQEWRNAIRKANEAASTRIVLGLGIH